MEFKNAQYHKDLIETDKIIAIHVEHQGHKIIVPISENNRHYAEILRQVKEGTLTIQDADE
tara:strand:+ start:465 stop:647 length:183 start_codon:yes stop_codon:yes gene_type:complete